MLRLMVLFTIVLSLASCGFLSRDKSKRAETERTLPFKAKLSSGEDKRDISVSVAHNGEDVEAVRESVRFQATKYCLLNFGGSETDWDIDAETGDWAFTDAGDALIFTGRCTVR